MQPVYLAGITGGKSDSSVGVRDGERIASLDLLGSGSHLPSFSLKSAHTFLGPLFPHFEVI